MFFHSDQDDSFIEDFDFEVLSSHLNWADDYGERSTESEKVPLFRQAQQSPSPPLQEPQMDLEADFPVGKNCKYPSLSVLFYILGLLICICLTFCGQQRDVSIWNTAHKKTRP